VSNIFRTLVESQKANQVALEGLGRCYGLLFAIVTNTADPNQLRRIKCTTESKGGLTETDWLMALKVIPGFDPPIPPVGSSVIIGFINGDPHDGVYLGSTINRTNPQDQAQADPVKDNTQIIPGDSLERIDQSLTIKVGKTFTLQNDAGAKIILNEDGHVILEDAFNNRMTLGETLTIALPGNTMQVTGASDVTIASKSVATIGAQDSRGDTLVSRGW
jgi:Type VI secretion system/phage-baseplate injector OB domain